MLVKHPDGGTCNNEGMTSDCYGCINYDCGLIDRCKERIKKLKSYYRI